MISRQLYRSNPSSWLTLFILLASSLMIAPGCQTDTSESSGIAANENPANDNAPDENPDQESAGEQEPDSEDGTVTSDVTFETVTFASTDELTITADLYMAHADKSNPFIVLCHQAGWSRGEYREIAPKLCAMGFNCMAIDQRSGGAVNEVDNATFAAATEAGKPTGFVDAEQDMIAAVTFVRANHADGRVLLWGSSYSSALALRIAGENKDLVDGVLSFAPGEYFERFGKPADWVSVAAAKIAVPAFITSAKDEAGQWESIFTVIPGATSFVPESAGNHGSRALWEKFDDNAGYWEAVTSFLEQFKN